MTKEQVLKVLQEHPDAFVSGAALAEQLHRRLEGDPAAEGGRIRD